MVNLNDLTKLITALVNIILVHRLLLVDMHHEKVFNPSRIKVRSTYYCSNFAYFVVDLAIIYAGFTGEGDDNVDEEPVDDIEELFRWQSTMQINDVIERYTTRDLRLQKVIQQDADMRDSLIFQKRKRDDLTTQLARTAAKHNLLASSRQVYQEVDMKDAALTSARKECEECQEREKRLRQNIESIGRAFPRFLTKITRVVHPIPTIDQVRRHVLVGLFLVVYLVWFFIILCLFNSLILFVSIFLNVLIDSFRMLFINLKTNYQNSSKPLIQLC